jgi:molybdopterin-guanine dinucleotide biosynthesis protein A
MSGVVLAGGWSTRMGREKALMPVRGAGSPTLLADRTSLLLTLGVGHVMISLRVDLDCPDASLDVVRDAPGTFGPLAGIAAALRRAPGRPLLVLGVDMPFVDASILGHIIRSATPTRGCAPRVGGRWEPHCAVYPPSTLAPAEALLREGRGSPSALLDALATACRVAAIDVLDDMAWRHTSWNRPEDVRRDRSLKTASSARGA